MQTYSSDSIYSDSVYSDSDKQVTRKQEKDRMQKQERSSEAIDFLQKERTSQAAQTYSSDPNPVNGKKVDERVQKREESDSRQKNYYWGATSQKKEQDTVAAGTNKPRQYPSFSTSIVTDPEIRQSPITTCWTTFTGSDGKSLLP